MNKVWSAIVLFLMAVLGFALFYFQKDFLVQLFEEIQNLGWIGELLFIVVFTIVGFPFTIGYIPLAVGAGYIWGMIQGTFLVSFGAISGAAVAFGVCRYFFYDWMKERLEKSPKWDVFMREVETNAWKITILIRLLPFPFGLVNGLFALSSVSFYTYMVGSFIGLLPFQVMWTYFGTTLRSLAEAVDGEVPFTMWQQFLLGAQVVAGIGMVVYFIRLSKTALSTDIEMGVVENTDTVHITEEDREGYMPPEVITEIRSEEPRASPKITRSASLSGSSTKLTTSLSAGNLVGMGLGRESLVKSAREKWV